MKLFVVIWSILLMSLTTLSFGQTHISLPDFATTKDRQIPASLAAIDALECNIPNTSFSNGEELKYKVYYNWRAVWMSAGKVTFSTNPSEVNGRKAMHMYCEGKTARAFNWFFKVHDVYETYIDSTTLRPLKFVRNVREGKYTKNNQYTYLPEEDKLIIDYKKRMGKLQAENDTINVPSCAQDLLSAIYYTRSVNYDLMEENDTIPVNLIVDGELFPVFLRYLGKDILETDLGKFKCVKFSPLLIKGDVFDEGEGMVVWATDDDNRVPIYIESPLSVGWGKAYLTHFNGLRHPLTSKLE